MNGKKALIIAVIILTFLVVVLTSVLVGTLIPGFINQHSGNPQMVQGGQPVPQVPQGPALRKPSTYKIGVPYKAAMSEKKPVVLLFYVDWCHYCQLFMPTFEKMAKKNKDKFNFVMLNVEDKQNDKLAKEFAIQGFPSVFIVNPTDKSRTQLDNGLFSEFEKVNAELDKYLKK